MALNRYETTRTSHELHANLEATGLSVETVADDLRWDVERVRHTLAVDEVSDPADVWELRDYLSETVGLLGRPGALFTVLTEENRLAARTWFTLRKPPKHTPR